MNRRTKVGSFFSSLSISTWKIHSSQLSFPPPSDFSWVIIIGKANSEGHYSCSSLYIIECSVKQKNPSNLLITLAHMLQISRNIIGACAHNHTSLLDMVLDSSTGIMQLYPWISCNKEGQTHIISMSLWDHLLRGRRSQTGRHFCSRITYLLNIWLRRQRLKKVTHVSTFLHLCFIALYARESFNLYSVLLIFINERRNKLKEGTRRICQ